MRILHINSVPYGSTCRVMLGIVRAAENAGIRCDTAAGFSTHPIKLPESHMQIGGLASKFLHMLLARLTGLNGFFSVLPTLRLIGRIKREKYDLLHFHNLHGWYVNLPLLTRFVKKNRIPIIWTLHDCWAWTGQCAHYTAISCNRWRTECGQCPQRNLYPQSLADLSRFMHRMKKRWFSDLPDLTLVTPSQWLAEQAGQSFLRDVPVEVIPNGVDLTVFRPTPGGTLTPDKYMVLGVAGGWTKRKGLDVFIELSKRLGDGYQIMLVGTDDRTERLLPDTVISIRRTQNEVELAKLYTAADVFVNPTYEDNFPMVNLEALVCGTPVAAFMAGGSAECLDETCGIAVPVGDVDALEAAIRRICTQKPFSQEACVRRASRYDQQTAYQSYLALYRQKAGEGR